MNAEVLAVGTELLMGQIANTNAQYISKRLPDVGVGVYYHSVVGDNPKRLKESLTLALKRSDAVIMTGGLGPTQDDLTKETVSELLDKRLVLHEESLKKIENFFKGVHRTMTDNNVKQAYLPEGCIVMKNNNGTAPGCIIEKDGKTVIMLPGPPSEMRPMFEENVIPYFEAKSSYKLVSRFIRVFGIGESAMETEILDLIQGQANPTIAPYAKEGEVTLRVTAKCVRDEDAQQLLDPVIEEIKKRLGNTVYSTEDKNMHQAVGELLISRGISLALAESCTGGLIASRLTEIPGISRVFNRGIVCYSNQSKIENLGVNIKTLEKHGAVSRETAVEMAQGILKTSKTDLGLSVTGIAGPEGGTAEKPVGLVYVALAHSGGVECKEFRLWGSRERIRNVTVLNALDIIRRHVLEQK
ncbi:competence/damage-inducible protein A [Anaerobacterium chartisolvens]|nr:competence/damage-inducible protein A [Anaerobacterium chartisolvens]